MNNISSVTSASVSGAIASASVNNNSVESVSECYKTFADSLKITNKNKIFIQRLAILKWRVEEITTDNRLVVRCCIDPEHHVFNLSSEDCDITLNQNEIWRKYGLECHEYKCIGFQFKEEKEYYEVDVAGEIEYWPNLCSYKGRACTFTGAYPKPVIGAECYIFEDPKRTHYLPISFYFDRYQSIIFCCFCDCSVCVSDKVSAYNILMIHDQYSVHNDCYGRGRLKRYEDQLQYGAQKMLPIFFNLDAPFINLNDDFGLEQITYENIDNNTIISKDGRVPMEKMPKFPSYASESSRVKSFHDLVKRRHQISKELFFDTGMLIKELSEEGFCCTTNIIYDLPGMMNISCFYCGTVLVSIMPDQYLDGLLNEKCIDGQKYSGIPGYYKVVARVTHSINMVSCPVLVEKYGKNKISAQLICDFTDEFIRMITEIQNCESEKSPIASGLETLRKMKIEGESSMEVDIVAMELRNFTMKTNGNVKLNKSGKIDPTCRNNNRRINQLKEEHGFYSQKLEEILDSDESRDLLCSICMNDLASYVLIPCGHLHYCNNCFCNIISTVKCSLCKREIKATVCIIRGVTKAKKFVVKVSDDDVRKKHEMLTQQRERISAVLLEDLNVNEPYDGDIRCFGQENIEGKKYSSYDQRLDSFKCWPGPEKQEYQDVKLMAKVGLFVVNNKKGIVKCFCCGWSAYDFMASDHPIIEHVRGCLNCKFLHQIIKPNMYNKLNEITSLAKQTIVHKAVRLLSESYFTSGIDALKEKINKFASANKDRKCNFCKKSNKQIAFLPCTHLVSCIDCFDGCLRVCPVDKCGEKILGKITVY